MGVGGLVALGLGGAGPCAGLFDDDDPATGGGGGSSDGDESIEDDYGTGGYGEDLDCADFDGPVIIDDSDPHGLDRDNDGIGCEANG